MDSQAGLSAAELMAAYNERRISLGLDLGHGRKLIQEMPLEVWESQMGPRPRYWSPTLDALGAVFLIGLACSVVTALFAWRWYVGLVMIPLSLACAVRMTGFPHPRPWAYLAIAVLGITIMLVWKVQLLPIVVLLLAIFASQLSYYLVGYWIRSYAARNERAFSSLVAVGILQIGPPSP